jgi:hypothetical protein
MTSHEKDLLVQRYIAGDLDRQERHQFREQLAHDAELKELLEHYSLLVGDLQDLSDAQMPADLWKRRIKPALQEHLDTEETFWTKVRSFFHGFIPKSLKPAFAVAGFIAAVVVITLVLQQQFLSEQVQPYARALDRIESLRAEFTAELDVLMNEMEGRKDRMTPQIRTMFDETMAKVDEAIEQAERIYAIYSDDEDAIGQLLAAYENKAKLLKQFINMDL